MISSLNHITLAVKDVHRSFTFYRDILSLTPLCKWEGCAYLLIGSFENGTWLCLDRDPNSQPSSSSTHYAFSVTPQHFNEISQRIIDSGASIYKENTSPGDSLYFLDPDGYKLEIHVGNWQSRIQAKKANPENWRDVEWFENNLS